MSTRMLTVNTGSSSLKVGVYAREGDGPSVAQAEVERIGTAAAVLHVTRADGSTIDEPLDVDTHAAAFDRALARLEPSLDGLAVIVHRLVHGGPQHVNPEWLTERVVQDLDAVVPLAPDHLPAALGAIASSRRRFPQVPQLGCFDTAFHQHLPRVAQRYPLPRRYTDAGVRRYGFHGLSCEYIVAALADTLRPESRLVIAHLGSGASLTAVRAGRSLETTMGFSPTGGIMMGTRTGDLDPGVLLYAVTTLGESVSQLTTALTRESGLLGVSGRSQDVRDLLTREGQDSQAADALDLFCYLARKALGGLIAVLGGLDVLVFTGGIGAHAPTIRARMAAGLDCFGITIDAARNAAGAAVISADRQPVVVRVMTTDEDRMLARHARAMLAEGAAHV